MPFTPIWLQYSIDYLRFSIYYFGVPFDTLDKLGTGRLPSTGSGQAGRRNAAGGLDNYEVRNEDYGFCCYVEETVYRPYNSLGTFNSLDIFGNDTMKIIEVTI